MERSEGGRRKDVHRQEDDYRPPKESQKKSKDLPREHPHEDLLQEKEPHGDQAETVYRHKHGSRIDHRLERLKRQRQESEEQELEAKKMEWGRGLVQRKEEERLKEELEELKTAPFARTKEDARLNEAQKSKQRWDDPARHVAAARRESGHEAHKEQEAPLKPLYKGYCPPNRFGIRPGHRWDGVDRSNGFEEEWFKAQAKKKSLDEVAYKWRTEDM